MEGVKYITSRTSIMISDRVLSNEVNINEITIKDNTITGLSDPIDQDDAITKKTVDDAFISEIPSGSILFPEYDENGDKIISLNYSPGLTFKNLELRMNNLYIANSPRLYTIYVQLIYNLCLYTIVYARLTISHSQS